MGPTGERCGLQPGAAAVALLLCSGVFYADVTHQQQKPETSVTVEGSGLRGDQHLLSSQVTV